MDNKNIISLLDKFQSLKLSANIDFDKFIHYAITHHSTTIEGSTLTEIETRLLLDEGKTPAGKPLLHSLMVQDHYNALQFVIEQAAEKKPVAPAAYFEALQQTRNQEDIGIFRSFMYAQYEKYLLQEIEKFEQMNKDPNKGGGYSFVF